MASTDNRFRTKPKRSDPSNEDCGRGSIAHVTAGKFYITGHLETKPNVGYQADSAGSVLAQGSQERVRGQRLSSSEESWLRLQPAVECGDDAMTLTVRRRRAAQLQLDRVNESSVPLSQLPPQCGYSVQTTWRDLSLMARYDACHVTQEDDGYMLPLLWRGTPVKMSCPASQIQPQQAAGPSSLCCSKYGMTVKVQGLHATEELRVNVRGEWTPLLVLVEQCGYTLHRRDAEILIAAPFITCGITVKDGDYTLSLQMGEKTFSLACPPPPPEELSATHQPLVNSPHLTRGAAEHMPESLDPFFPWAPPFYLAPPYYPHPAYHHKYPSPAARAAHDSSTPASSTPDPTFGPKPLPAVAALPDYQDYYPPQIPIRESYDHFGVHSSLSSRDDMEDSGHVYPDLQQKQETTVSGVSERPSPSSDTGSLIQDEPPPLQPPNHAFNPYYHYYHHPKIPLPGPPQDPDPGPGVPGELSLANPHNPEYPVLPPDMQQSVSEAAPSTPQPPQPYPYHHYYYYFPHIPRGEVKRLAPLTLDTAANTNMSDQNTKSHTLVHPLPRSSQVLDKVNPHMPNSDKMITFKINSPDGIKDPLLSEENEDVKAELDDKETPSDPLTPAAKPPLLPSHPPGPAPPLQQQSFPPPSANHNPPPYPYYYHPLYHYPPMYHHPEILLGVDNRGSPTSSKEALDPPRQPSYGKRQTTAPPTKPMYDTHNGPLHPYYYYYHLYYHPHESVHNQELHSAGSINSERASSKSESLLPSEAGYPSIPPLHGLNSQSVSQQHPYDPFRHPAGEEAEERLDDELKDHLEANPSTPSASPRGLGPVSDFDCGGSSGCCSYPVNKCTTGQHLVFAVPDSVVEPTVAPQAHPSELSNVSCTLQKLTSDPDIYTVPLDGCGVNKRVFGETLVHLLEVHGIYSLQQDHSSVLENSPVRLMVECSSSPGSPSEVRLYVMDRPPPPPVQSTPVALAVLLRIATDKSFASFHPESHLPLSLMRGRPVYVEVSLLDPPEPGLVLLVHSCLAYTQAPYPSWMLAYDSCLSQGDSQLLPPPRSDSHHIRRIPISGFLSVPTESPSNMAQHPHLEDPEIYFLCLTEVCSGTDGDCTISCINSPNTDT